MKPEKFLQRHGRLPTERDWVYLRELEKEKLMDKFTTHMQPIMHPGKCIGCTGDSYDGRVYVDLGTDIQDYAGSLDTGRVYLCSFCIKQLYELVSPPQAAVAPIESPPEIKVEEGTNLLQQIMDNVTRINEFISSIYSREQVDNGNDTPDGDSSVVDASINLSNSNADTRTEDSRKDGEDSGGTESRVVEQDSSSNIRSLKDLIEKKGGTGS